MIASVDGPADAGWDEAWQAELLRREQAAAARAEPAPEWSTVRARILAKLATRWRASSEYAQKLKRSCWLPRSGTRRASPASAQRSSPPSMKCSSRSSSSRSRRRCGVLSYRSASAIEVVAVAHGKRWLGFWRQR
ncbi:MAG: hypothetical protein K8M05_28940 [Deltaproteobacteria bacterium]|nr:hypothetical protein [Kofleriaceae bacterium]